MESKKKGFDLTEVVIFVVVFVAVSSGCFFAVDSSPQATEFVKSTIDYISNSGEIKAGVVGLMLLSLGYFLFLR